MNLLKGDAIFLPAALTTSHSFCVLNYLTTDTQTDSTGDHHAYVMKK